MSHLYGKIDVALPRDPRMIAAGPMARMLYVQCFLYGRENLTNGEIDTLILPLVAVDIPSPKRLMAKLVAVGALEVIPSGWRIPEHVWRRWNPLREEVDEARAQKAEAGAVGNHKRWHTAAAPGPKCDLCRDAGWLAHASHNGRKAVAR